MPTFIFFRSGKELERFSGASPDTLEKTVSKLIGSGGGGAFSGKGYSLKGGLLKINE